MDSGLGNAEILTRTGKVFLIRTPTYSSEYHYLDSRLQFFVRKHQWRTTSEITEAYGGQWLLFIGRPKPGQVAIKSGGIWWEASGPFMAFFPKHSLVHWRVERGLHIWGAFRSDLSDLRLPREPAIFDWAGNSLLSNFDDICTTIEGLIPIHQIAPGIKPSPVAQRIKHFLDLNFTQDLSMPAIAQELGLSYSSMTHTFKRYFEISPSAYRAQVRLFTSISRILNEDMSVADSCFANGHSDFSSFYKKFRKSFLGSPSQFRWQQGREQGSQLADANVGLQSRLINDPAVE